MIESLRWIDLYGVKPSVFGTLIQDFHRVSSKAIHETAGTCLIPERMTVVVVGDRKALWDQLQGLAHGLIPL